MKGDGRLQFVKQDLRQEKPRHHRLTVPVEERGERAWDVVKVYGSQYPADDRFLDVLGYAELCEEELHSEYLAMTQVAITNPITFIPPGWAPPGPVKCRLHLETVPGARVTISEHAEVIEELIADRQGRIETVVSPLAELTITAGNVAPVRRSIFLDYVPVRRHVEYCYTGQWRSRTRSGMLPGQVPWSGFAFAALREALQDINWCIKP